VADPAAGPALGPDDLRAAVAAGVLSERQAARLTALAHSRRGAREHLDPGDEPFELFRGFNEVFIMVGLTVLAGGWVALCTVWLAQNLTAWRAVSGTLSVITAGLVWLLSEYFTRQRRMIGPAILLSAFFAATAAFGLAQWKAQVFMLAREDYSSLILPGFLSVLAVLVYWLRFRVPFAVAMLFDGSDPHRVTRRSAQGFWLHLVAAPMIINTVALSLLARGDTRALAMVLVLMALFAVVAVVIDRRSFLLAAIGYVVSVFVALDRMREGGDVAVLVLSLGLFLVVLGAFWARIRAGLLRLLPLGGLRRWLPPAH